MGASLSGVQYEFNSPTGFAGVVTKSKSEVFAGLLPAYSNTFIWFTSADRANPIKTNFRLTTFKPAINAIRIVEFISTNNVVINSSIQCSSTAFVEKLSPFFDTIYPVVNGGLSNTTDVERVVILQAPANQVFSQVTVIVSANGSVTLQNAQYINTPPVTSTQVTIAPPLASSYNNNQLIIGLSILIVLMIVAMAIYYFNMNSDQEKSSKKSRRYVDSADV